MLDGVHAADARAHRVAERLVAGSGAQDEGDVVGDLAVARAHDPVVRAGGGEQPVHLHAGDDVLERAEAVLGLELGREEGVAGGEDDRADLGLDVLALHVQVDAVGRADVHAGVAFGADTAVEAAAGARHRFLFGERLFVGIELARLHYDDLARILRRDLPVRRLPAQNGGLVDHGERSIEIVGIHRLALKPAVHEMRRPAAEAGGGGDHGRARDHVAGGEHVRDLGLHACRWSTLMVPDGLIGSPNSPASGLMPAATIDQVALDGPEALVGVLGTEPALLVEHRHAAHGHDLPDAPVALEVANAAFVTERDPFGRGLLDLRGVGRHLLQRFQAEHLHRGGLEAERGAGRVDGDVTAADDHHSLALHLERLAELGSPEELGRPRDALEILSGNSQLGAQMGPDRHQDGVVTLLLQGFQVLHPGIGCDGDADVGDVGHVLVDDLTGEPVRGKSQPQHASRQRGCFEDLDLVPFASQVPGRGQSGRTRAYDGHLLAVRCRDLGGDPRLRVMGVGQEALDAPDVDRALQARPRAFGLAGGVAGPAQAAHQRGGVGDELEGLLVLAPAGERHVPVGLDARRAREGAGGSALAFDHGLLGHRLGEGDVGRPARDQVGVELVGYRHAADHLALTAARAGRFIHEAGLPLDLGPEAAVLPLDALHLCVGEHRQVGMMDGGSHLGSGDATGAVERGEDLAQQDHPPADAPFLLDHQDLVAHVAEFEGGFHAADAAADDQSVVLHAACSLEAPGSAGPAFAGPRRTARARRALWRTRPCS